MYFRYYFTAIFALLSISHLGCGSVSDELGVTHANPPSRDMIGINLSLERQSLGLVSASVSEFSVHVTSCSSGYSTVVESTDADPVSLVSLYRYDTDCQAELASFVWAGETWTRDGGGRLASGSAIFNGSNSGEMMVTVYRQLASPLLDGGEAIFIFQEIVIGADFEVSDYSFSETIEVLGLEAPNVSVFRMDLTAIASGTGIATFTLSLECEVPVTGGSSEYCTSPEGVNQDMRHFRVAIVYDDYSGSLSFQEAGDIIDSHGVSVLAAHLDSNLGANGGLETPGVVMDEGPLYDHRNLLVVVSYEPPDYDDVRSFRYFKASIGEP